MARAERVGMARLSTLQSLSSYGGLTMLAGVGWPLVPVAICVCIASELWAGMSRGSATLAAFVHEPVRRGSAAAHESGALISEGRERRRVSE